MMVVVLSLSVTSSLVVPTHRVADGRSSLKATSNSPTSPAVTRFDPGPTNTTTATTPPVRVRRPTASHFSPITTTFAPTAVRDDRTQNGDRSRPETEVDRSIYDGDDIERSSNSTTNPVDNDDGGDDGFKRRRFYISAAQVNYCLTTLTLSLQIPLRLYTLPYWSNPPFLIFDIRAAPECQKLKMMGYASTVLNPSSSSNLKQLALKGQRTLLQGNVTGSRDCFSFWTESLCIIWYRGESRSSTTHRSSVE